MSNPPAALVRHAITHVTRWPGSMRLCLNAKAFTIPYAFVSAWSSCRALRQAGLLLATCEVRHFAREQAQHPWRWKAV